MSYWSPELRFCFKMIEPIQETADWIAFNKPAGISTHRTEQEDHFGFVEALALIRPEAWSHLRVVHRLDKMTSGVLLLAKTAQFAEEIIELFKVGEVEKSYLAWVQSSKLQRGQKFRVQGETKKIKSGLWGLDNQVASNAVFTDFEVEGMRDGLWRLVCHPRGGRTHQIRVHLMSAGLPIYGDQTYGPSETSLSHLGSRHLLHAQCLRWKGTDGSKHEIVAGAPDFFSIAEKLSVALWSRFSVARHEASAFRMLNGNVEGLPGILIEIYHDWAILQRLEGIDFAEADVESICQWLTANLKIHQIVQKTFFKDRSFKKEDWVRATIQWVGEGEPSEASGIVKEGDYQLRFWPRDGLSTGIFLDQRNNRSSVRAHSDGKAVLNLFCYTGSFSVAAAIGGAQKVTSVDISKKALQRVRENFALNGLNAEEHQFIAVDARDYLQRAAKAKKEFDLIILDPPVFARVKGQTKPFRVEAELHHLIAACGKVLKKNGTILVTTNLRSASRKWLAEQVKKSGLNFKYEILPAAPMPQDFRNDPHISTSVQVVRL